MLVPVPDNTSRATILVTVGKAKYDAARKAIVWKVGGAGIGGLGGHGMFVQSTHYRLLHLLNLHVDDLPCQRRSQVPLHACNL